MGADLFGSYVATILATMVLGREIVVVGAGKVIDGVSDLAGVVGGEVFPSTNFILLPMVIAGLGLLFSIIGAGFCVDGDCMALCSGALLTCLLVSCRLLDAGFLGDLVWN